MEHLDRARIERELHSDDDEARRLAVERAGLLAPVDAVPLLVECLGDPSWRVRKAAIDRLASTPEPARAATSLLEALADGENPGRRNAALEALIRCGSSVVPTLLEASAEPDVDVRKQVVDALCGIADPGTAPRLVELLDDPDANVRGAAADALGAIGRPEAAAPLLARVRDDEERLVRLSCLRALSRIECPVASAELEASLEDSLLRSAALEVLGHSDDPMAAEALLKGLSAGPGAAREAAAGALLRHVGATGGESGRRLLARVRQVLETEGAALDDLLARLEGADLARQLPLVQLLALAAVPRAMPGLLLAGSDEALAEVVIGALGSDAGRVDELLDPVFDGIEGPALVLACRVLGRGTGPAGERRLLDALSHPEPEVRAAAAEALGGRCSDASLARLVGLFERAAEDEDADGRVLARLADAIVGVARARGGEAHLERADELVAARLHEGSEAFRCAAAGVLAALGGARAVDRLGLLLSDPSPSVRRAAVSGLTELPADAVEEPLRLALADEAPSVRIAAAGALVATHPERALHDLEQLVVDEDPRVRAAAMRAVGRMVSGGGGERLERGLAMLERGVVDDGPVAMAAVEVLRDLADPRAVGVAGRLLEAEAPELVCAAVGCLETAAEAPRLEVLIPLLAHEHWSVRAEAARVLGERGVRAATSAVQERLEGESDDFVREALLGALARLEDGAS